MTVIGFLLLAVLAIAPPTAFGALLAIYIRRWSIWWVAALGAAVFPASIIIFGALLAMTRAGGILADILYFVWRLSLVAAPVAFVVGYLFALQGAAWVRDAQRAGEE